MQQWAGGIMWRLSGCRLNWSRHRVQAQTRTSFCGQRINGVWCCFVLFRFCLYGLAYSQPGRRCFYMFESDCRMLPCRQKVCVSYTGLSWNLKLLCTRKTLGRRHESNNCYILVLMAWPTRTRVKHVFSSVVGMCLCASFVV